MDVVSNCALRAAEMRWTFANGGPALTVVCKGTFVLQQGEATLAPQQDAPVADETYWEEPPERGGAAAIDLVPFKPRADVVIVGHAYAPPQRPARSVTVRAMVGAMDKAFEVFGDRTLTLNGELREAPPWNKRRLGWDRAAGGPDTSNPNGLRFDVSDGMGATAIPNQQPSGTHFARRGDTFAPVGFGPIGPSWQSRAQKLYRHARAILSRDWPSRPLPDDIDRGFFNVAPPDQQIDELHANERILLDHLHPEHARLVTRLPGVEPTAMVMRPGRAPAPLPLTCDTLWIDTDRAMCSLVWRGTLALAHPSEQGQVVITTDTAPMTMAEPVRRKTMMDLGSSQQGIALPFARSAEARDPQARAGAGPDGALPFGRTTGAHALRDLSASTISGSPPSAASPPTFAGPSPVSPPTFSGAAASPQSPPTFSGAPPPRASESGMRRAVTIEIPPSQAAMIQQPPAPSAQPFAPPPPLAPVPSPAGAPPPSAFAPPPSAFAPPPPPSISGLAGSQLGAPPATPPPPPVVVAPPALASSGLASSGMPSLGAVRPPQGSIGERLATEQAMAESKALLDRRTSGEPENIGPLAKASVDAAEAPAAATAKDAAPRRGAATARDAITLLWLDSASVPRMRKKPAFREILDELEEKEHDLELDASVSGTPADVDDHRSVFEILTQGAAADGEGLQRAMIEALREDGKFVAPMLLLAGELAFPFDELETLRATVITVSPVIGPEDLPLKAAVESARELLKTPDLTCSPAVAEGMTQRIRDAFSQGKRVLPAGYLDAQTERSLLDQRRYQRRNVFGGPHLRALLHLTGSQGPVPCYLPDAVGPRLPLFQRFRTRLIATCHLAEDQNETHPAALKVLALARLSPPPGAPAAPGAAPKRPS